MAQIGIAQREIELMCNGGFHFDALVLKAKKTGDTCARLSRCAADLEEHHEPQISPRPLTFNSTVPELLESQQTDEALVALRTLVISKTRPTKRSILSRFRRYFWKLHVDAAGMLVHRPLDEDDPAVLLVP